MEWESNNFQMEKMEEVSPAPKRDRWLLAWDFPLEVKVLHAIEDEIKFNGFKKNTLEKICPLKWWMAYLEFHKDKNSTHSIMYITGGMFVFLICK